MSSTETHTFVREVRVDVSTEGDGRTLVSRLVPYNELATVNDGDGPYQETFLPGAFDSQTKAASRIKAFLNFRHRQGISDMIGHATKIEDRADGLHGELRVLENPDGDKALQLVEAGMLDRLSIEFAPVKDRIVDGVTQRVKARLVGVALVPEGAYAGAQVLAVREEDEPHVQAETGLTQEQADAFQEGWERAAAAKRALVEIPPPLDAERLEALGLTVHRAPAMPTGMTAMPTGVKTCRMNGQAGYMGGTACHVHDGTEKQMAAAMAKAQADAK